MDGRICGGGTDKLFIIRSIDHLKLRIKLTFIKGRSFLLHTFAPHQNPRIAVERPFYICSSKKRGF